MKELERDYNREIIHGLMNTFVHRTDMYAVQTNNGSYYNIRWPLREKELIEHLQGYITFATYLLKDNTAKLAVIDADNMDDFRKLSELYTGFDQINMPAYLEDSRRGGHLWFFFEEPVSGKMARNFGLEMARLTRINAEVFPKQAEAKVGSCIRLPFGIHMKSGERYSFLDRNWEPLGSWDEQIQILSNPGKIPLSFVEEHQYQEVTHPLITHPAGKDEPLWERVKQTVSVYDLVSTLVPLKETPYGAIGHCPFHEDDKPSFSINIKDNYWNCFAGCGGGSVIDFWMKFKNMEFNMAVKDLAHVLDIKDRKYG